MYVYALLYVYMYKHIYICICIYMWMAVQVQLFPQHPFISCICLLSSYCWFCNHFVKNIKCTYIGMYVWNPHVAIHKVFADIGLVLSATSISVYTNILHTYIHMYILNGNWHKLFSLGSNMHNKHICTYICVL